MINIYDVSGNVIMRAEITSSAKREEELSKSDYISLSWSAGEKVILPVGAYINYTYRIDTIREVTRKFLLLESYEPTQTDEMSWKYTPDFQHPKMMLSKVPFYILTRNSQKEQIKQHNWSFVGTMDTIATKLEDFLNKEIAFGNAGWTVHYDTSNANTVNVSFSDNDFISSLTAIVNAIGDNCEWHIDYDNEIIYIGKVCIDDRDIVLKVGENVGAPSISNSKEDYYNSYAIFGGTRNITQVYNQGENISSNDIRLQLDKGAGYVEIDGKIKHYTIDDFSTLDLRQDKINEPQFTKVLDFSQIFPSLNTYVYNVRGRKKYVLDSEGNVIPLSYNDNGSVKEFKTFTVWYMRLAYPTTEKILDKEIVNTTVDDGVTHYWYDFEITDDMHINGKNIGCSFEANFNKVALTTPLAGRGSNGDYVGFELTYHEKAEFSSTTDDLSEDYFQILAGDYEITYQEDQELIIPTNADEMLIPKGESLPSFKCNITVLYNIAMADKIYQQDAKKRLLDTAIEEITRLQSDLNNYTVKSYAQVFIENNPRLQIGQKVTYDDGNGYTLSTRVLKLSTNIDYDFVQEITVGNQAIKGTITQLKDDVESIIASGGGKGSGGGYTASQLRNLIGKYGISHFLYKGDTSVLQTVKGNVDFDGLISFEQAIALIQGLTLGANGEYSISKNGDTILRDTILRELTSSDYDAAAQTGYGMKMKSDGKYKLSLTDLEVWGRAIFHELEVRKLSYAGGNFLFSPAGSTIFRVDVVSGGYQCYFLADDGSTATENLWKVGDLALCESFNIEDGAYTDVGNKRYWRKVIAVSTENEPITDDDRNELYDGQKFGWVTLSATDCETDSDTPAAGDTIVCLGNASDTSRQNAIIIKTMGDENVDAPAFIQYAGINTYSLTGKDKTVISPSGNKFTGDFVTTAGENLKSALSELKNTVKGITTTVSEVKSTVDGHGNQLTALETDVTQIKQTAESISLKVDRQSVKGRNLIPMSYFFHTSNAYGTDTRKFLLESGKKYSFSVNGHIDTALKNGGGVLRVFIYNAAWSWSAHIDIDATTDTTAKLEGDNAITPPSTGEYYLSAYAFHADIPGYMKAQEGGTFTLNWAQLEEGEVCTPWSLHESDPAIQGNLLPSLGGDRWTRMVNITTEGLEVNGVRLPNMHYSNEATTSKDVLSIGGFALEGNSSYTLSFWVKGSGTMESYVYPDAVMYAEDNAGQTTTAADGCLGRTLSSVWERVRIRFNTKQLNTNALYNAGFDAMGGTQTTWSYLWDFTGKPTRPTRVKVDGYYPAYVQKSATTDAFCDLSQDVGATLTAGWWTLTFKVRSSYAVRLLVSGVTFGAVDGSGNTVCVDGTNEALPASGDVRYLDFAASSDTFTEHSVTFKVSSAETTARLFFRCYDGDFYLAKPMLTDGASASGFATREAGQAKNILPCRLLADSEVWIGGVKLEQGGTMTDYSEDTVQELYATGIDILNRSITVTADNFTIENNRKERTFSVDAEGRVTMNHISLGGTINKQAVEVTADNFGSLFDFYLDEVITNRYEGNPKIANLYGIYYFTEAIGKATKSGAITLNMPSAYQDDDGYYCGNVWDDNNNFSSALLRSIRALVGNTVLIYNDSPEDICVYGMSPYFTDVWVTANSAKIAAATTAETTETTAETTAAEATIATTAVEATFSPSTKDTATDATSSLERDTTGSVAPNQRYAGKQRDYMTVTLQGGKHQFVSLTCVCEVGKLGRENIYWLVNYGAAFDTE